MNQDRHIRVFISSTFRDMQEERDHLVKFIFPQLRKMCEERGVTWTEVDLRWGIPDEQKAEGKVLPICLEEIRRCRPYFIGLLGERYGWVPDEIPRELIEREAWLAEHLHQSVTELEILHGVLNNPAMADHALFYFRDPAFVEKQPADVRSQFVEVLTEEETKKHGEDEAKRRADERKQKLVALKDKIRTSGLRLRENYDEPKAVCEMVLQDMTAIIDRLYPKGSELSPLDQDASEHEAFAQSRARVYIGRQEYFDRLDEHARDDGQPLVVLGESGSGKSALLANWALEYRDSHPEELLLMHFIGATPYSADWAAMVRRILGEFKRRLEIEQDIPDQPDALRGAFANWLHMAAAKKKVVLILDALNQLEDRDSAPDLVWLPPVTPPNIRLIVSALPGRAMDELNKRGWPTMRVQALVVEERKQLIKDYLAQFSRALSAAQTEAIASAQQSDNPLYLRALLDELRVFGIHEKLTERIEHFLTARTIPALYEKILIRWESDYEGDSDLVGDSLSLIYASRRGLSEAELLQCLGRDGQPMPRALWSPFYLACEQSLICRSGLLNFGHAYLREAVREAYLPTGAHERNIHLRLASHFEKNDMTSRQVEELPWQFAEAHSWQQLCDLLVDRQFFLLLWVAEHYQVKMYWTLVEGNSHLRMVEAYSSMIKQSLRAKDRSSTDWINRLQSSIDLYLDVRYSNIVAQLLHSAGHLEQASGIWAALGDQTHDTGDYVNRLASLGNRALVLKQRGEIDEAMRMFKDQERLCRVLGNEDMLAASLSNQALILQTRGELDKAMRLQKEVAHISRKHSNKDLLSASLLNQALILETRGEFDDAMALLSEAEGISRESANLDRLSASLGNQASILRAKGRVDEAKQLLNEAELIYRQLGDLAEVGACLVNRANCFHDEGKLDEAMRLQREAETIFRKVGNKSRLAGCLNNQATILMDKGELNVSFDLLREVESYGRELDDKNLIQGAIGNQASILFKEGNVDAAMQLRVEQEQICRRAGIIQGLQNALGHQAWILVFQGKLHDALRLNQDEEQICRTLRIKKELAACLGNQVEILMKLGDLDNALRLCNEQGNIYRECGSIAKFGRCLITQGNILSARGSLDEAMQLYEEEERICREWGDVSGLVASLTNQSYILRKHLKTREALVLAEEAYQLVVEHGLTSLEQQIQPILKWVRGIA